MLKRYGRNIKGKLVKQADIYLVEDHGIDPEKIDKEARKVCNHLVASGFESYIVGGAIRDLLLGISPKDFDIVTNADPKEIRRACGRSRIIGRRFPLVHVVSGSGRIFEVATFRSLNPNSVEGLFGTMYEDAFRRDFSMNALYYDPETARIFDFHDSCMHIKNRQIIPIIPPVQSFIEDPVRMLRAIKYGVTTSSSMSLFLQNYIRSHVKLLERCSKSRLTEELNKVLQNDQVFRILKACFDFRLLDFWLPSFTEDLRKLPKLQLKSYWDSLQSRQEEIKNSKLPKVLQVLFESYFDRKGILKDGNISEVYRELKLVIFPLVLPNVHIERAIIGLFQERNLFFEDFIVEEFLSDGSARKRSARRRLGRPRRDNSSIVA